jgi:hypothetical protein
VHWAQEQRALQPLVLQAQVRVVSQQAQVARAHERAHFPGALQAQVWAAARARLQQAHAVLLAQRALERPEQVQQAQQQTALAVPSRVPAREPAQAFQARESLAVCGEPFRRPRRRSNWSASSSQLRQSPATGQ